MVPHTHIRFHPHGVWRLISDMVGIVAMRMPAFPILAILDYVGIEGKG